MNCDQAICISENRNGLAEMAAEAFVGDALQSVSQRGLFFVALSGGSTPRDMHRLLKKDPWRARIPWSRTHIFWVDERCVPQENPASNYGAAKRDFVDELPISRNQIHFISCETSPSMAAEKYQDRLRAFFAVPDRSVPRFDLIFLGLGTDGHTASLFPGSSVLAEKEQLVVVTRGGDPYTDRISMTLPLLNRARHVVFLVSGREKSEVLQSVLTEPMIQYPAQAIRPSDGKLTWLLDRAAASLLPETFKHG
jgi:6-phosphogluconolactonase